MFDAHYCREPGFQIVSIDPVAHALFGRLTVVVGGHVLLQWLRAASVQEVDDACLAVLVGAVEASAEVWQQVHFFAVLHALGQDTRDHDTRVGHRIYERTSQLAGLWPGKCSISWA